MSTAEAEPVKVKKFVDYEPTLPDALQVGEYCYAKYKAPTGDLTWFVAKIHAVRKKLCDPVQVEFKKTLSGISSPLLLPSPTRAWVDLWSIRRDTPNTVQLEAATTPLSKRACVRNKGAMNVDHLFKESIKLSKTRHAAMYKGAPLSVIRKSKVQKSRFSPTLSLHKRRSESSSNLSVASSSAISTGTQVPALVPAFEVPPTYMIDERGHVVVPASCVEVIEESIDQPSDQSTDGVHLPEPTSQTEFDAAQSLLQMTPPPQAQPMGRSNFSVTDCLTTSESTTPVLASAFVKSHVICWYMVKS